MIKIYVNPLYDKNIIKYTFNELFRYINNSFKFVKNIEDADIIYSEENTGSQQILIIPSKLFWNNYKKSESLPLSPLPIKNNIVYIYENDIIASSFFLLSGYEEYLNPKRDKFNRFLYQFSYYKKDGIYDKPIVEEYREFLINNLNKIGIGCKRKNIFGNNNMALFLTHDVDAVYKYRSTLKSLLKILLKPSKFSISELIDSKKDFYKDPYFQGFNYLIEVSKKYGFKSTFFFISKVREKLDDFYHIKDIPIQKVKQMILENNFEIGLHGSIQSSLNQTFLEEEKSILNNTQGIRQHYLMYEIFKTPLIQTDNFLYDTTLGFADMIGFRRGTCLPFHIYDIANNRELLLYEIPLNVMEVTLKVYMDDNFKNIYEKLLYVISKIEKYNGVFTLLWHPGNCSNEWQEWLDKIYEPLLLDLSKRDVLSLTGKEIIELVKKNEI